MTQQERAKLHYLKDRDKYLERAKRQRKYAKAKLSPEQLILERTRVSAKKRGLECDLTVEDILLPEVCPYLGIPLKFNEGKHSKDSYSVDRLDNTKGYVKGNIEVISYLANAMKRDASQEEQLRFAKEIVRRYEVS